MKKITIDEFLKKNKGVIKKGWAACDKYGWVWFSHKPVFTDDWRYMCAWIAKTGDATNLSAKGCPFSIAKFKGNSKDSLRKVE